MNRDAGWPPSNMGFKQTNNNITYIYIYTQSSCIANCVCKDFQVCETQSPGFFFLDQYAHALHTATAGTGVRVSRGMREEQVSGTSGNFKRLNPDTPCMAYSIPTAH